MSVFDPILATSGPLFLLSLSPKLQQPTMRAPTTATASVPTEESLREMMAMAAAAASAAAGDAAIASAVVASTESTRVVRASSARSTYNRRQSISQLPPHIAGEQHKKGAPLPPIKDGARLSRINTVAREIALKWIHPRGSLQYETDVLHQVRAILYMNRSLITQSFVSQVSGVSQGSLSHYVRGLFKGNQSNVEERLGQFVQGFCEGKYDEYLEDARHGHRPIGRPSHMDIELPAHSSLIVPQAVPQPEQEPESRPPIPPPPPPQLQPAPWAPRIVPTAEPQPQPQSELQPELPSQEQQPQVEISPAKPPMPMENSAIPPMPQVPVTSRPMTDRARRAHFRQLAQQQKVSMTKRPRAMFPSLPDEEEELTSVLAVERAYQVLVASKWNAPLVDTEALLIPIELYLAIGAKTLHMVTQWDVNERHLSPEYLANRIRIARSLPPEFMQPAAMQIRRHLYQAGVICPPPPNVEKAENRRLIKIVVDLHEGDTVQVLRDEFEWDLGAGCINSPELFAQHLCTDANINQKHAAAVATAVRQQIVRAQAIAYGDDETKKMALEGLAENDPIRMPLPSVTSALTKTTTEDRRAREREENELTIRNMIIEPILDSVQDEADKRMVDRAKNLAEEKSRKELQELRRREADEIAQEDKKLENALKAVDDRVLKIFEETSLDFRPYLQLRIGRGERPSIWMPAPLDRRRRNEPPFPMPIPVKKVVIQKPKPTPLGKRRRSARREEIEGSAKRAKTEAAVATETADDTGKSAKEENGKIVSVRLRIRAPREKEVKPRSSGRKRRR